MRWLPSASTVVCHSSEGGSSDSGSITNSKPTTPDAQQKWRSAAAPTAVLNIEAISGRPSIRAYSPVCDATQVTGAGDHRPESASQPTSSAAGRATGSRQNAFRLSGLIICTAHSRAASSQVAYLAPRGM